MKTINDPIHGFMRFDDEEIKVINSLPMQRLRNIHQVSMCCLVYPAATHKRFEHSLGACHLAGVVFDTLLREDRWELTLSAFKSARGSQANTLLGALKGDAPKYRRWLRFGALLHDLGHAPFSHITEGLMPEGCDHESFTVKAIKRLVLANDGVFKEEDLLPIAWISVGEKTAKNVLKQSSTRVADPELLNLLSRVVTSDACGVDRIDYLLRDGLHTGVRYGQIDYGRLLEMVAILPPVEKSSPGKLALGILSGGIHAVEELLLARYFMFQEVYAHPTIRLFNIHLLKFLESQLKGGLLPTDIEEFLKWDDNRVLNLIREAGDTSVHATALNERKHFRRVLTSHSDTKEEKARFEKACNLLSANYGEEKVTAIEFSKKTKPITIPVFTKDQRCESFDSISSLAGSLPTIFVKLLAVSEELKSQALDLLSKNKTTKKSRPKI